MRDILIDVETGLQLQKGDLATNIYNQRAEIVGFEWEEEEGNIIVNEDNEHHIYPAGFFGCIIKRID